jgi:hypothetical protein
VQELERQARTLKLDKQRLEEELEEQKRTFRKQILQEQERTQEQLAEIKKIQRKIEIEAPAMKEKMELVKQQISGDLVISEAQYLEYKGAREDQLSLKEYVLLKVYESVSRHQEEAERARKELRVTKEKLLSTGEQLEGTKAELAHAKKTAAEREADTARRFEEYTARTKDLEQELRKAHSQVQELREKGLRYDQVHEQLKDTMARDKVAQAQLTAEAMTAKKHSEEIQELTKEMRQYKEEAQILRTDKNYLQADKVAMEEKNKRLEDKNDQLLKDLEQTKTKMNEYIDKLLHTKDDVVSKYEAKYMSELNDLKDRHKVLPRLIPT